jgi:hypothetical protein
VPERSKETDDKRDWRISAILVTVWIVAMIVIKSSALEIPVSMLVIASAFFIFLIPAMNDLVRSIERFAGGRTRSPDNNPRDRVEHD